MHVESSRPPSPPPSSTAGSRPRGSALPRLLPRRLALAALVVACTACGTLPARDLVALEVVDREAGLALPAHRHRGQDWIAGTPGRRYGLRLRNVTAEPVLVVVSVDGVNVVTGETAHPAQAGYVLAPWQVTDIDGWRKSDREVAEFVFAALPDSYAVRTGRPHDVGTIGIAVFREARQTLPVAVAPRVARERDQAASPATAERGASDAEGARAATASAATLPSSIGTGHGARAWSPVSRTTFVRASRTPDQLRQWRYDDGDRLAALGIVAPAPRAWRGPDAFPGGYVPDPRD